MAIDSNYNTFFNVEWFNSILRENEDHVVVNNKFLLDNIPDKLYKVTITGYTEITQNTEITLATQFKVNYNTGEVTFDSSKSGDTITVTEYYGKGIIKTYSKRQNVVDEDGHFDNENAEDVFAEIGVDLENQQGQINNLVVGSSNTTIGVFTVDGSGTDTITGTFSGIVSYFDGLKVSLRIVTTNTGAVTFNLNSISADSIKYVDGSGVKQNVLAGDLIGDSIILIEHDGTDWVILENYSKNKDNLDDLAGVGRTTETVKQNADSISANTDAINTPDFSDTQEHTASIFSLEESGVPASDLKGQLSDVKLSGLTITNILDDDVAGCEATTGWTASNITLAIDNTNEYEGTNCLKGTLTATSGYIRRDIFSDLDVTKYYLITAHFKNVDLATGLTLKLDTDDVDVDGSVEDSTTYTRVGIVIQPTDIDSASYAYLTLQSDGANAEYAYVDAIMLNEITAAEYALGADAIM